MKTGMKILFIVVIVALLGVGVFWAKTYYNDRYIGSAYYTVVPSTQNTTIETLYSNDGKAVDKGRTYAVTAYNEKGEMRVLKFEVVTKNPKELLQPGTFLEITASKQIVIKQKTISKADIPKAALAYVVKNQKYSD